MLEDSNDGFQIVHSRKKKNVAEFERKLAIESEKQRNNNCHFHDEGIGCSPTESPTECDEILGKFKNRFSSTIFFYREKLKSQISLLLVGYSINGMVLIEQIA